LQNIAIPEPQNPVVLDFEAASALGIVFCLLGMLAAIDFNSKAFFHADKIYDESSDGMLSAKSVAIKLAHSKMSPQESLRVAEITS
jgi:hypothetical protein